MNVNEYGIAFHLNVNFDISGFTALSLVFTKPSGAILTKTNGDVTVPASPLVTSDQGTFAANEYVKYTFVLGDISEAGTYSVRLTYTDASKRLISDVTTFTVSA